MANKWLKPPYVQKSQHINGLLINNPELSDSDDHC